MTKEQNTLWNNYQRATARELHQVYSRCSQAKRDAMDRCRRIQAELEGYDGRICSANSWQFSYAFQYDDEVGDVCLCYITKDRVRKFVLG